MNRDELERKLRVIITGCTSADGDCTNCHCTGNAAVYRAMAAIDAYTVTLGLLPEMLPTTELWTAEEVAAYVGQSSPHAARSWLSRNGIRRCGQRDHEESGRPQSLYPANHVRAVAVRKSMR